MLPSVSSSSTAIGFFSLLLVSLFITQYDIEEVQQHCNHTFSQQEIVSLYERFCQLDHSGGGFIFVDEFLSVLEFAPNPLSQFWLGGRRYWGRGIGARPHLLLGDASVSTPNFLFSSERFDPTTKLLSFGGEFRKIFKGGLTKNKRFFALLSSPALMQIGKLYVGYYVAMKGFYALLIGIGVGIHGVLLFITLIGKRTGEGGGGGSDQQQRVSPLFEICNRHQSGQRLASREGDYLVHLKPKNCSSHCSFNCSFNSEMAVLPSSCMRREKGPSFLLCSRSLHGSIFGFVLGYRRGVKFSSKLRVIGVAKRRGGIEDCGRLPRFGLKKSGGVFQFVYSVCLI